MRYQDVQRDIADGENSVSFKNMELCSDFHDTKDFFPLFFP